MKMNDLTYDANLDALLDTITNLQKKYKLNISNTNDFFNSIQAETDKRTKKIKEIEEKQKDINDSIEKSDRKLRILKGIDNDINQAVGSKNREQIKSDIANLNTEIKACNKEIKKYEEQLQKCIEYNQKLGKEQMGYDVKKDKINYISEKIMKVKKDIGDKLNILEDIENSIKAKNVVETDFMGCKIIVRKNDLTEERTDAIVNPANEALIYEGGLTKAVADKGGDIVLKESNDYIQLNGKLPTGHAILGNGGNLLSRWIIHAVGPKYK